MQRLQAGGKLMHQGAYGCVYHPALNCNGTVNKNSTNKITKIQEKTETTVNEDKINRIVKTIPGYTYYFAPITTKCQEVYVSQLKNGIFKDCYVVTDQNKQRAFVTMDGAYIDGTELIIYLTLLHDNGQMMFQTLRLYQSLLTTIEKLQGKHIVHFDLKSSNILIDSVREKPIVIDFGLSHIVDELVARYSDVFFMYAPNYYVLPPEVHTFSFVYHRIKPGAPVSIPHIVKQVLHDYKKDNPLYRIIGEFFLNVETQDVPPEQAPNFVTSYFEQRTEQYLTDFLSRHLVNNTFQYENMIQEWVEKGVPYTWDMYGLAMVFMPIAHHQYSPSKSVLMKRYIFELFNSVHPDPSLRKSVTQMKSDFTSIFGDVMNTGNVFKLQARVQYDKYKLKNILSESIKQQEDLTKYVEYRMENTR